MPISGLIAGGFGFGLAPRFIPTLGFGASSPTPPPSAPPAAPAFTLFGGPSTMSKFATPQLARIDWAALIAASTPYATAKMLLFTNDLTPDQDTQIADYTEATFGGYTAGGHAVTWDAPYIDGGGDVHLPSVNNVWVCSAAPFESIYGYYLVGAAGENLGGARFDDAPRNIIGVGYGIDASTEVIV
jgi:hypothetical protein